LPPINWGSVDGVVNPGLNPGWIQPPVFYNTTSPVQGRYYWGQHAYQPGPTFDPLAYNNVPGAPDQPWGLQQMYTPLNIEQYLRSINAPGYTPIAGPVAPRM
jgi:hypothetical protein